VSYTHGMSRQEPWYKDGLHFTCTHCGNCCSGDPGVVWIDDNDIESIAKCLGKSIGEVRLFHTRLVANRVTLIEYANGDCTFFDAETRRCTIYPVRPRQCRSWPFWRSNLKSEQTWKHVQKTCPEAGNGAFVSLEDIESEVSRIDM